MRVLFKKLVVVLAGVIALFGISVSSATASVAAVNKDTPFYLENGSYSTGSSVDIANWHSSHVSHGSHVSHHSHYSGY
jgi:hypothetical protein